MIIAHNIEAQNIAHKLKTVNYSASTATERLNTGYRVNRAADDAAGLAVSEKMRAQIRGLKQGSSNVHEGMSLTRVADGALNEIHAILQRERELMVQSANDTYCEEDRQAIEEEIIALNNELDRMFDDAEYNTIKIFHGNNTIIQGPDVDEQTVTMPDIEKKNETENTTVVWIPKEDIEKNGEPQDEIDNTTTVSKRYSSSYTESEEMISDSDDPLHPPYKETCEYVRTTTTTTTESETATTYKKSDTDPRYTTLQEPGRMVSGNGYINVRNVARNLDLSCAMSQLGIIVDGEPLSVDLYDENSIHKNTVMSPDQQKATTTYYFLDPIMELDQIIELTDDGKSYIISYALRNTDPAPHDVTVRLAFDVMNLDYAHAAETLDGVDKMPFNLENDDAAIQVSASGVSDACLTNIEALYDVPDKSKVDMDKRNITHTGAGFWWNSSVGAGASVTFGSVKYGPIDLKKIPYEKTESTKDNITISEETVTTKTETVYKPQYLDIQVGANAFQMVPMRMWNLSTETLKCRVPTEISAFNPQDSLVHLDRVLHKTVAIRSYYGAMTNRMEHAYMANDNTAQNLTAAESAIRDADMAQEILVLSKNNILQQAGNSLMAQANQSRQGILTLLR